MTSTATMTDRPAKKMTLAEFLELPETEPASEFICGRIEQKPMPAFDHAALVTFLILKLGPYLLATGVGRILPELRHADDSEERAYLPDVSVILKKNIPKDRTVRRRGPIPIPPDLAIEVLSAGDRSGRVADKLAFYLRTGVPLTWIIDPLARSLTAYRQGQPSSYHEAPDVIDAAPVLPDFRLDLQELFDSLDLVEEPDDADGDDSGLSSS